jgi:23S rRNA (guanosine2251-2'-O)-methyltransferase
MKYSAGKDVVPMVDIGSFLQEIEGKNGVIVLMYEMNDPHNVGAIIRSAAAFGALGVIIPTHNQSPISETVERVSVGTIHNVPIIKVININTAILKLKEAGFWIYGLTEKGSDSIYKTEFDKKSVIIVGNEHSGIDAMALKKCDFKIQIPINEKIDSLNASVSAGIALYEFSRQK